MAVLEDWLMPGASVAGGLLNMASTALTNRAQKKLAKYQFDLNHQMWEEQNEYNKPVNQVLRLKEAGLNPQLQYGNGTLTGNTSGNMPQYDAPTLHAYQGFGNDLSTAAASYAQAKKLDAELLMLKNQADAAKAMELKTLAQVPGEEADSTMRQISANYHEEKIRNEINRQVADLQELDARIRNLDESSRKMVQDRAESISRIALNNSNIKVNNKRIQEMAAHIRNLMITGDIDEFYANLARGGKDPGIHGGIWNKVINTILTWLEKAFGGKSFEEQVNEYMKEHPDQVKTAKSSSELLYNRTETGQSPLR